jgi:hypothetical protein
MKIYEFYDELAKMWLEVARRFGNKATAADYASLASGFNDLAKEASHCAARFARLAKKTTPLGVMLASVKDVA